MVGDIEEQRAWCEQEDWKDESISNAHQTELPFYRTIQFNGKTIPVLCFGTDDMVVDGIVNDNNHVSLLLKRNNYAEPIFALDFDGIESLALLIECMQITKEKWQYWYDESTKPLPTPTTEPPPT